MKYQLNIWRQKDRDSEGHFQNYTYETDDDKKTVAQALREINEAHPADQIRWENSCLQKKCGACAMVINNVPSLACGSVLSETAKKGSITIEPLRKFPVVADLMVDRSVIFDHLESMEMWAKEELHLTEEETDVSYEAARCLQCGCCLEVCPNFYTGGQFYGMAAMTPSSRLIASEPNQAGEHLRQDYKKHVYAGCGKSLACQDICPAMIDVERLMSRSNAASVWRRRFGRKR